MTASHGRPSYGEVWFVDLNPPGKGHEQHNARPALIVSADEWNHGSGGMVVVIPITTAKRGGVFFPLHVEVLPPDGGLYHRSLVMVE